MSHYSASITHTPATIHSLYRTQRYTYHKPRILLRTFTGFCLVLAAVMLTLPVWAKGLLLASGAWLMVSQDFPAQVRADKVIQSRKTLPAMQYVFSDDGFTVSGEGSMSIPYKKISRLIHDNDYCYIFMSGDSVCMMDKPDNPEEFMKFVEGKTGQEWRRTKSLMAMNIDDIREIFS